MLFLVNSVRTKINEWIWCLWIKCCPSGFCPLTSQHGSPYNVNCVCAYIHTHKIREMQISIKQEPFENINFLKNCELLHLRKRKYPFTQKGKCQAKQSCRYSWTAWNFRQCWHSCCVNSAMHIMCCLSNLYACSW